MERPPPPPPLLPSTSLVGVGPRKEEESRGTGTVGRGGGIDGREETKGRKEGGYSASIPYERGQGRMGEGTKWKRRDHRRFLRPGRSRCDFSGFLLPPPPRPLFTFRFSAQGEENCGIVPPTQLPFSSAVLLWPTANELTSRRAEDVIRWRSPRKGGTNE